MKNQKLSLGFLFGVAEVIKQLLLGCHYVEPDDLSLLIKLLINHLYFAVLKMESKNLHLLDNVLTMLSAPGHRKHIAMTWIFIKSAPEN